MVDALTPHILTHGVTSPSIMKPPSQQQTYTEQNHYYKIVEGQKVEVSYDEYQQIKSEQERYEREQKIASDFEAQWKISITSPVVAQGYRYGTIDPNIMTWINAHLGASDIIMATQLYFPPSGPMVFGSYQTGQTEFYNPSANIFYSTTPTSPNYQELQSVQKILGSETKLIDVSSKTYQTPSGAYYYLMGEILYPAVKVGEGFMSVASQDFTKGQSIIYTPSELQYFGLSQKTSLMPSEQWQKYLLSRETGIQQNPFTGEFYKVTSTSSQNYPSSEVQTFMFNRANEFGYAVLSSPSTALQAIKNELLGTVIKTQALLGRTTFAESEKELKDLWYIAGRGITQGYEQFSEEILGTQPFTWERFGVVAKQPAPSSAIMLSLVGLPLIGSAIGVGIGLGETFVGTYKLTEEALKGKLPSFENLLTLGTGVGFATLSMYGLQKTIQSIMPKTMPSKFQSVKVPVEYEQTRAIIAKEIEEFEFGPATQRRITTKYSPEENIELANARLIQREKGFGSPFVIGEGIVTRTTMTPEGVMSTEFKGPIEFTSGLFKKESFSLGTGNFLEKLPSEIEKGIFPIEKNRLPFKLTVGGGATKTTILGVSTEDKELLKFIQTYPIEKTPLSRTFPEWKFGLVKPPDYFASISASAQSQILAMEEPSVLRLKPVALGFETVKEMAELIGYTPYGTLEVVTKAPVISFFNLPISFGRTPSGQATGLNLQERTIQILKVKPVELSMERLNVQERNLQNINLKENAMVLNVQTQTHRQTQNQTQRQLQNQQFKMVQLEKSTFNVPTETPLKPPIEEPTTFNIPNLKAPIERARPKMMIPKSLKELYRKRTYPLRSPKEIEKELTKMLGGGKL